MLEVSDLTVEFHTDSGIIRAVDSVSFELQPGEILGIVGESGSGKSVSCLAILGLLQKPAAKIVKGSVRFMGKELTKLSEEELRQIRGRDLSMIFQDPFTSLNPYLKISTQLMEVIEFHSSLSKEKAYDRCIEVLDLLGVPDPDVRMQSYPHQLSGGLKQRIMIAMSLLLEPKLIIADEPTTALDVTIQAQILELLKKINELKKTSIIMITHDLGVVAGLCHRVQVMYAGRVVETGLTREVFYNTKHQYTQGLLNSIPNLEMKVGGRLKPIPGMPPDLSRVGEFCSFAERCASVSERCRRERPQLESSSGEHRFACFHPVASRSVA